MPRNVYLFERFVDNVRAFPVKVVDDAVDHLFVARDGAGGNDDRVVFTDCDLVEFPRRHARERAHRLALTARGYDDDLAVEKVFRLFDVDEHALGNGELSDLACRVDDVEHAPARKRDLSAVFDRKVHDLLQAVHVGRKRRDNDAPVRIFRKEMIERGAHHRFTHRITGTLHIRRFAEQEFHPFPADLGNAGQVDLPARDGREIDLEVAAVEDPAVGRIDAERDRARDGMVHVDKFNAETAEFDLVARLHAHQMRLVDALFAQFVVRQRQCQLGAVYGRLHFFQKISDAPHMVFMPVGNEHAAHFVLVLHEIADVGNDQIDAGKFLVGERQSCIDDDDVVAVFDRGHVLADLAYAAEKDDLDGIPGFFALFGKIPLFVLRLLLRQLRFLRLCRALFLFLRVPARLRARGGMRPALCGSRFLPRPAPVRPYFRLRVPHISLRAASVVLCVSQKLRRKMLRTFFCRRPFAAAVLSLLQNILLFVCPHENERLKQDQPFVIFLCRRAAAISGLYEAARLPP